MELSSSPLVRAHEAARRRAQRANYDLIVDDIYEESGEEPRKPPGWRGALERAYRLLRPGGILVVNLLSGREERIFRG